MTTGNGDFVTKLYIPYRIPCAMETARVNQKEESDNGKIFMSFGHKEKSLKYGLDNALKHPDGCNYPYHRSD